MITSTTFPVAGHTHCKKMISKISLHTEGKALTFFLLCPILTFQLIQYTIIEQSEDDWHSMAISISKLNEMFWLATIFYGQGYIGIFHVLGLMLGAGPLIC